MNENVAGGGDIDGGLGMEDDVGCHRQTAVLLIRSLQSPRRWTMLRVQRTSLILGRRAKVSLEGRGLRRVGRLGRKQGVRVAHRLDNPAVHGPTRYFI
jgi:hypothetical protein